MREITEKIYCYDRGDNNNALAAAIMAGNNRRDNTFPNGKTGYLGALGEWQAAYNNKTKVNSAMSLIGGTPLSTSDYYWSSTQYSDYYSWEFSYPNGYFRNSDKYHILGVRAFCLLSNNQNT